MIGEAHRKARGALGLRRVLTALERQEVQALLVGSGVSSFLDSPIDMDTQRARYQANYNGDFQWQDDMTKTVGKHTFQFGMQLNKLPYTHVRADKVVGSLASIVATVDGDQTYVSIPTASRPLTCSASVTGNCITSANLTNWDRFYASALGIVDNVNVLAVRDAHPAWGARKIVRVLEREGAEAPAASTVHAILARNDRIVPPAGGLG